MTKVSIIVPVYNVEKYLSKCLTSLVKQTLKDIEIIIVNDGTQDKSQDIIDKYKKKYKNIKSYKKENGGLSSARNYGLVHATGEYIAFVDSDDWVELDMYEKMYNKAKELDFDIVVCDFKYIYPDKTIDGYSNISKDLLSKNEIKISMLKIFPAVWNKIFKKTLFENKIRFKEKIWFEDVEFIYKLYPYISSMGVIHEKFVNYLQRSGNITSTFDIRLFNYIDNWNGIIKYYKEKKLYSEYKKILEYCYVRYVYGTFIKNSLNFKEKFMYNKAVITAIDNVNKNFPKYRKNLYFYKNFKGIYLLLFNRHISKMIYLTKRSKSNG